MMILIDAPICKSNAKVHYGVAKHETAKIECEVDADPPDVVFHWGFNITRDRDDENQVGTTFNNGIEQEGDQEEKSNDNKKGSNEGKSDLVAFVSDGRRSVASYKPLHESDYGVLYCYSRNSVGKQREPCVFFVIQSGKLSQVRFRFSWRDSVI